MKKDISIMQIDPTTNSVIFVVNKVSQITIGASALAQKIIKRILTLKGSNYFEPSIGTGFFGLLSTIDPGSVDSIKEATPILINDLAQQIKDEQAIDMTNGITYADDELLSDIQLTSVDFDDTFGGWLISLNIITKSSNTITISL